MASRGEAESLETSHLKAGNANAWNPPLEAQRKRKSAEAGDAAVITARGIGSPAAKRAASTSTKLGSSEPGRDPLRVLSGQPQALELIQDQLTSAEIDCLSKHVGEMIRRGGTKFDLKFYHGDKGKGEGGGLRLTVGKHEYVILGHNVTDNKFYVFKPNGEGVRQGG